MAELACGEQDQHGGESPIFETWKRESDQPSQPSTHRRPQAVWSLGALWPKPCCPALLGSPFHAPHFCRIKGPGAASALYIPQKKSCPLPSTPPPYFSPRRPFLSLLLPVGPSSSFCCFLASVVLYLESRTGRPPVLPASHPTTSAENPNLNKPSPALAATSDNFAR
jgi:hypothetical protein